MPGPTGYNIERLEKLRTEVEYEGKKGKHDQGSWGTFIGKVQKKLKWDGGDGPTQWAAISCPSSACAAGWTVINEKAQMLMGLTEDGRVSNSASHCVTADGQVKPIETYAAELLGLDPHERDRLFAASPSTRQTLYSIDQLICAAKHNRTWAEQRRMDMRVGV